ncbi:Hypothetical predicted protein [Mytilus galloprovincialis]|nr:Hypothetical predicted protein [Mytilus galloprovincialis]
MRSRNAANVPGHLMKHQQSTKWGRCKHGRQQPQRNDVRGRPLSSWTCKSSIISSNALLLKTQPTNISKANAFCDAELNRRSSDNRRKKTILTDQMWVIIV